MRRRLDLAASLIATPPVLFLDEPTTGPRPAQPHRAVGRAARAGPRRHHAAAHHPVPRGGRPARRRHRRHRPRPDHRRRARRSSSRTRPARASAGRHGDPRRRPADGRASCCAARVGEVHVDAGRPALTAPADGLARHDPDRRRASPTAASSSTTSACKRPSLDDVFLHLTGHRAEDEPTDRRPRPETVPMTDPSEHLPRRPPPSSARRSTSHRRCSAVAGRSSGAT